MLKLSDFFQPLNLITLSYFLATLLFFDVLGTIVKKLFIKSDQIRSETRLINWLLGLGFFIFVWFLLGQFFEPNRANLLISIGILFSVSFPFYFKSKDYTSLIKFVKPLILPIILIVPFLPPTFVKASLPPYAWDEMAYHFIAPGSLYRDLNSSWVFSRGIYGSSPRLMDILYTLSFSLFHTYSVVRLIQFSILITSLWIIFLTVKKNFGWLSSLLFFLIFLSLPLNIPSISTIGYVDIVAFSCLMLGLIFGLTFMLSKSREYLILSIIFWAMSIGTKYTTLVSFGAFIVSLLIVHLAIYKSLKRIIQGKALVKLTFGAVIFGGYWYIKNLIIYGNPIYPFLFRCWGKYAADCAINSSFFGDWTTKITLNNLFPVIKQLLPQNPVLILAIGLSVILVVIFGDKKGKITIFVLGIIFALEFAAMKYFSGFDPRYNDYLVFYLILIPVLLTTIVSNNFILRLGKFGIIFVLASSCLFFYFKNLRYLNSLKFVNWNEINYSVGKMNINQWIDYYFPKMRYTINWCQKQAVSTPLARFDPEEIWTNYEGLMRVYITNCYYSDPPLEYVKFNNVLAEAKDKKMQFWIASISRCTPGIIDVKSDKKLHLKALNNLIICNSKEVQPYLYYFDYRTLKL